MDLEQPVKQSKCVQHAITQTRYKYTRRHRPGLSEVPIPEPPKRGVLKRKLDEPEHANKKQCIESIMCPRMQRYNAELEKIKQIATTKAYELMQQHVDLVVSNYLSTINCPGQTTMETEEKLLKYAMNIGMSRHKHNPFVELVPNKQKLDKCHVDLLKTVFRNCHECIVANKNIVVNKLVITAERTLYHVVFNPRIQESDWDAELRLMYIQLQM
jgi:hypothetical protein